MHMSWRIQQGGKQGTKEFGSSLASQMGLPYICWKGTSVPQLIRAKPSYAKLLPFLFPTHLATKLASPSNPT